MVELEMLWGSRLFFIISFCKQDNSGQSLLVAFVNTGVTEQMQLDMAFHHQSLLKAELCSGFSCVLSSSNSSTWRPEGLNHEN